MNTFQLTVATPDGSQFSGEAEALFVRGTEGDLAVLAGHIPFVTALKAGECRVYIGENGETIRRAQYTGGMLTVSADTVRMISADFRWEE